MKKSYVRLLLAIAGIVLCGSGFAQKEVPALKGAPSVSIWIIEKGDLVLGKEQETHFFFKYAQSQLQRAGIVRKAEFESDIELWLQIVSVEDTDTGSPTNTELIFLEVREDLKVDRIKSERFTVSAVTWTSKRRILLGLRKENREKLCQEVLDEFIKAYRKANQ